MKVKKNRLLVDIINAFIFVFFLFLIILDWDIGIVNPGWVREISILALFLMVYQAVAMIFILKIKYTEFLFWFILLEFVFLYGRIWVKAMGKDDLIAWHLFNAFDDVTCYKAALFCLAYSQAVFLGCFLLQNMKSIKKSKRNMEMYPPTVMYRVGWSFFTITFPIKLYANLLMIAAQRTAGDYVATGVTNGFITAVSYMPVIGLLLVLCSKKMSKINIKKVFCVYLIYEVFYMVFSGDRRQDFIGIISWILCYMEIYNIKTNFRKIFKYILISFFVLIFLATIRTGRSEGFDNMSSFVELFSNVAQNDLLVETLGEFGGTFFTVTNVIKYYPEKLFYLKGLSLLGSTLIIIPGFMTFLFPTLFYYAEINYRCKDFNGLATGGSLPQEMYANWGLFGLFFAIIAGMIIAKIMTRNDKNINPYDTAMYYARFSILLNLVRASTYELGRPLAYTYLLVYLLGFFFRRIGNKKGVG